MAQFLDLFSFLSVLLRGLTLSAEALTLGGVVFLLLVSRGVLTHKISRFLIASCVLLVLSQAGYIAANSAILMSSTSLTWLDLVGAGYFVAGLFIMGGGVAIAGASGTSAGRFVFPVAAGAILAGSVMTSHAFGRLHDRALAAGLTLAHQIATAAWIGAMPYLLVALRHMETPQAVIVTNRFSRLAIFCVAVLFAAGIGLSLLYIGSVPALGTTYGAMVIGKIILTLAILSFGSLNFQIVRAVRSGAGANMLPLRRFAEAEIGIGFTVVLAAAALTSAPPAIDVKIDRVTAPEIVQRIRPKPPVFETPPLNQLSPPTPLRSDDPRQPGSFVPGSQRLLPDTPGDIAWSEYNHHWAGLIVLAIGLLGLASRRFRWARNWPLIFLALAAFLLVRSDPENWPLGPRGFWESFTIAEVAQHRIFVLLLVLFAAFEWAVQTGHISGRRAGLVFPLVCAVGGALLLTHSHSLTNVKQEFLIELSHLPLAILAVLAGWSRWLEIRLPAERTRVFAWVWPACFVLIGLVLLNYREV
ncbi:MAG: CopD family protein [Acidobacteriaceae bacterium]|nr:CopD family protein [Acidobacteriaceae bacterium]